MTERRKAVGMTWSIVLAKMFSLLTFTALRHALYSVGQPLSQLLPHSNFSPLSRKNNARPCKKKKKKRIVIAENTTDHL